MVPPPQPCFFGVFSHKTLLAVISHPIFTRLIDKGSSLRFLDEDKLSIPIPCPQ